MSPAEQETVLEARRHLLRWHGPKAGMMLFNTVLGEVVVTSRRFLFLTAGEAGLTGQFTVLGEKLSSLVHGETRADELDLSALSNEHSLAFPLEDIRSVQVKRRWDFATYLSVVCTIDGKERAFAFMSKLGMNRASLEQLQETLDSASAGTVL